LSNLSSIAPAALLLEAAAREPQRLAELVLHLQEEKGALQREAENLQEPLRQRNHALSQQLEKLERAQRAAFRQAAPFRREGLARKSHAPHKMPTFWSADFQSALRSR
jgi:septal ring factor EnvC (AmiA/AmiB activator)